MIEINESMLVQLAGVRAFGQGLRCFEEDCVRDVVTTDKTTNAVVQDQQQYSVRLRHTHRMMEGECGCDVSDGIEFCQHCVAVALHLQARLAPKRSIDKRGALRQISRHLSALSHEDLLDEFFEAIKQNPILRKDMLQKARLSSESLSFSDLKKMIDAVGAEDNLSEYKEIRAYFEGLESMLMRLIEFADKLDPLVLLRAAEHATRRLNVDLKLIDDADEFPEQSMEMLTDMHLLAVRRLQWAPGKLASYLVDRGAAEYWDPRDKLLVLHEEDFGDSEDDVQR